jgi:hypothetical protein
MELNKIWPICAGGFLAVITLLYFGVMTAFTFGLLWAGSLMFIEWATRQADGDRRFIRRLVFGALIALIAALLFSLPASALSITGEQTGEVITWTVSNGTAPYEFWVNGGPIGGDAYPGDKITSPVLGGHAHYAGVKDATNATATTSFNPVLMSYPGWVWAVIGLWAVFCFASTRIYIASYAALILGGFLMLTLMPDTTIVGYLRLVSAFFFIVGLSLIFIFKGE